MTALEAKLYVALLGARTIVAATANVNPRALKLLKLVDEAAAAYKAQKDREQPVIEDQEETVDAAGE